MTKVLAVYAACVLSFFCSGLRAADDAPSEKIIGAVTSTLVLVNENKYKQVAQLLPELRGVGDV